MSKHENQDNLAESISYINHEYG